MGWEEASDGGTWSSDRRPRLFRRHVSNYVGIRDALAEFHAASEIREKLLSEIPGIIFINHLAERIGYERFREIVIPRDDQSRPFGRHTFENRVIEIISEALSGSLTAAGRKTARRSGGPQELLFDVLTQLDFSPSQAMEGLVYLYGETEQSRAALQAIEAAEAWENAHFRATIANLFG